MKKLPPTLDERETFLLLDRLLKGFGSPQRKRKAVRNFTMAALMLDAGLRVSELCGLSVEDLFYEGKPRHTLHIRPEIAKLNNGRYVPLTNRCIEAINSMDINYWRKGYYTPEDFAFARCKRSKTITPRQVERIICSAARASIGRSVHPHMLRHTFATRLMRTTSTRIVQELLGHKNLASTQVYTHPNADDLTKAIGSLNP